MAAPQRNRETRLSSRRFHHLCRRFRRSRSYDAAGLMVLAVPLLLSSVPRVPSAVPASSHPAVPVHEKPVPVHVRGGHQAQVPAMPAWHPPATVWPSPGSAVVSLNARAAAAGDLPVQVGPADAAAAGPGQSNTAAPGQAVPARVQVSMAPRAVAQELGIPGVVFTVSRADGAAAGGRVHVSLDYSGFAYAYGGDYASRLRLVELPACALTTPQAPACRQQTPVGSADDVARTTLGADVTLPAAGSVLATTTTTGSDAGDYTATPLTEAGSWAQAGSSGAFTYSYPVQVPPVPGGLEPTVNLSYNSQMADGLTSSTNNQASWIGDGWEYAPGYIERTYQSCLQNSNTSQQTGDFCWSKNDITTLYLNGTSTTLVRDDSTGAWHPKNDAAQKVQYLTGAGNGTYDGGYWVITATDGTQYYFGMNQLPGYGSGDTATNSSWNMPVYQPDSSGPCYNSTWASSHCYMAWRWNLDYVVDPHQNAIAYFYNTETNYYAAGSTITQTGTKANAAYQQAGALQTIEYGLRAGAVYGGSPAGEVTFDTPADRTDIPSDLSCANGASCIVISPTFWGKYRLASITTSALNGSSLEKADSWTLSQSYPSTGDTTTPPSLWLSSIARDGLDGGSVQLPPVQFSGTPLPNRAETPADMNDGYSIITRMRMHKVTLETGGVITVTYDTASGPCTGSGSFPAADANTGLCYPDFWTPPAAANPVEDWFNKYVVTAITQQDTTGGGVPVQTAYSYAGAAWHYNDSALTRSKQRTWDQWRGFRTVTTETGVSPDPVTKTVDTYLQGMDGDYQSGGGTASVSVTSSRGDTVTDSDQWAGLNVEHIVDDGTGGGEVSDTVTLPWSSGATATHAQPAPLPPLKAYQTGVAAKKVFTVLASGGARESDTSYTHDSYGRVTSTSSVPDTSDASQDTCITVSYADNTSANILDKPARSQVVSVPCGTTPQFPANAVSDTLTFYDGATSPSSDTPSAGDVTQTEKATSYSNGAPVYTTVSQATYDQYGRVLTATDADNRTTRTAYTPSAGAEPTSETATDPMGLQTTTDYDPARDLPVKVTDAAGYVTTETYDALGRLTAVWLPGHPQGTQPASDKFSYSVSNNAASVTTSDTVNDTGGDVASETLYDSLGRQVETQDATVDGGRDITDAYYNSDGWKLLESNTYYTTGAPDGTLVAATDNQVPSQTGYVYDGAGRVTRQISYKFAAQTWETDTSYGGNYTTVVPPAGGTSQTTFADGRGLTTAIYQYHNGVPAAPSDPASDYDRTSYTYTGTQQLATIKDAAGNTWSYGYDLLGNETSQTDPDAGAASSLYDNAGQLMSVTDPRGKTLSYTYDKDGRKTAEYDTTGGALESSADEVAAWKYDTLAPGLLSSSTSYYGGAAFTEQVLGYDAYGLSEGVKTIIPSTSLTGALAGNYEVSYAHDSYTSALTSAFYSADGGLPSETVNTGYDSANEPVALTSSIGSYVSSLSYTELGQPHEYTLGTSNSPVQITDTYDQQTQRLTGQQTVAGSGATTVDSLAYTYDNVGNVTSEADTPSGGPSQAQCFQYDYLGRLTTAWSQGNTGCVSSPSASSLGGAWPYLERMSYDVAGNLTTNNWTYGAPGSQSTVGYQNSYPAPGSAGAHRLTSQLVSSSAYGSWTDTNSYDPAGQLTQDATPNYTNAYSWDDAGRLASFTNTPAGSSSGSSTSYYYDAGGNLLLQVDPGSTTLDLPDEQLVLDTGASPATVSGTRYYTFGGGTVAARTSAGTVDYLAGDQQDTMTVAISFSSSSAMTVTRRYFGPYGQELDYPSSMFPGNRGFVGGTTDQATGLVNLGAREYDPVKGQFMSPDPILKPWDPQDLNPYGYGLDNPSTNSDPTGADPCQYTTGCGGVGSAGTSEGAGSSGGGSGGGGGGGGQCGGSCYPGEFTGSGSGAPVLGPINYGDNAYYGGGVNLAEQLGWTPKPLPGPPPVHHNTASTGQHQSYCATGAGAARFGLGQTPGCVQPPAPKGGGGFNPFASLSHLIAKHWRGIAQTLIAVGSGIGGVACLATVACGVAGLIAIGAASSVASYETSGGRHTLAGAAIAGGWGAGSGLLAGIGGSAFNFAAGRAVSLGGVTIEATTATDGTVGAGVIFGVGSIAASGAYGAIHYRATTSSPQQTSGGALIAVLEGAVNPLPFELPKFFGEDQGGG